MQSYLRLRILVLDMVPDFHVSCLVLVMELEGFLPVLPLQVLLTILNGIKRWHLWCEGGWKLLVYQAVA